MKKMMNQFSISLTWAVTSVNQGAEEAEEHI
jgi:hypothetical protein